MESKFNYLIVPEKLERDTVYVFPDPERYGNIEGVGGSRRRNPIIYTPLNNRIKNISSALGRSLPKSRNLDHNFHTYSSREQYNFNLNNSKPLRNIPSLHLSGAIVKEVGDIFGNQFYVFDQTDFYNKNLSGFNTKTAALPQYDTVTNLLPDSSGKETITSIRNKLKPIQVYNIKKNTIELLPKAFGNVFNRYLYDSTLYKQVSSNQFSDFNIFENTYFIKTESFFIIDSINYNPDKEEFEPAGFISRVRPYNTKISTQQDIEPISNFSNPYEVKKDIFYIEVKSSPTTNPINLTTFNFEIFKFNKEKGTEVNLITKQTQAESFFAKNFTFNVGSKITQVSNVELSFNSKQNKFTCISNLRDLNNVSYIHVLVFKIIGNTLNIVINYVIGPDNFNTTQNFYQLNEFSNNFRKLELFSNNLQETLYGTFRF